jgi:hypothetical protein
LPKNITTQRLLGRGTELGVDLEDLNRLRDVLEPNLPLIDVLQPRQAPGQPRRACADEHLASVGPPAETGRDVERSAPKAAVLQLDGLTRLDADADPEWKVRAGILFLEASLKVDAGADRLARGGKDGEGLISSDFDQAAAVRIDLLGHQLGKGRGQPRRCFVAVLLGETGVAAHVSDQDRANAGLAVAHNPSSIGQLSKRSDRRSDTR